MKKLFWLFLLLASPGLAWGQAGGRFDNVAQKNVQNFLAPIPGASITICAAGATGTPCTPVVPTSPVTLCTDSTCAVAAPNPFPADGNGNFGGWLLPGNYTYSVTATGVTGKLFNLTIPAITPVNLATQTSGLLNLATQVTGTLPGANYAAVNLAGGNTNGGVTGVLPAANHPATTSNCSGVQFAQGLNAGMTPICTTPPTFVASGASHAVGYVPDPGASAGTTHFLREDATWATIPASGVSEATWGGFSTGSFGTIAPATFSETTLTQAHTLKRFTVYVGTPPSGCTTSPVESLVDLNGPTTLTTLTLTNNVQFQDSGTLTVSMTAGHTFAFQNTTASSGCTTQPANGNFTAVFQ